MKKYRIILFSLILQPVLMLAQINRPTFDRISIHQGLSQSSVLCIIQDSKDFLWFGTYDGLNRYDGYHFKVYKFDPEDDNSLSNSHVECMIEDRSGYLWIGTQEGLNRFDRKKEQFIHYKNDPDNSNSISKNYVRYIFEDRAGILWIATYGGGLNRFDKDTGTFTRYTHNPNDPASLGSDLVLSILEDSKGRLWIGTDDGLNLFDRQNGNFIRYIHNPQDPHSISHDGVWRIYEDRAGHLWIGTWGGGLNLFDPARNRFTRYMYNPDNPRSLSHNVIRSIGEDSDGNIWIGTDGGGLNIFDPGSAEGGNDSFIHFQSDRKDQKSLSSNSVLALFQDKSGILWLGTDFGGINYFDPHKTKFALYRNIAANPDELKKTSIFSVYEDSRGIIWIGTNKGGLNRFDRQKNQFTRYVHNPLDPESLSNDGIRSICEDRYNRLWIGTDYGLNRFDPINKKFIKYIPDPDNPNSISHPNVWTLYKDKAGNLWAGTISGLNQFDYENERFIRYMPDENNPQSISDSFIWSIHEDSQNLFWIATNMGGLNRFDPGKRSFSHYSETSGDSGGFSENKVLCIHEDRAGTLWFGTPNGLNRWERQTDTFTRYSEKDGLPNNVIQGILEDDHGNLWISTNKGLSKFNPQTRSFNNYFEDDGLQSNEFCTNACFRLESGEMIFGGIDGFNIFHPDSLQFNPYIPSVVLTDLEIFNKSISVDEKVDGRVVLKEAISESKEITLSHKDNVFSFEFAALHYVSPKDNLYAYRMDGFDKEWNYLDASRRFVTYTNLPGGKYTFRVKASNNDGIWNEEGTSIRITITPPLWQTWWFKILALLSAGLLIYTFIEYRLYEIKKQRKMLEGLVRERTQDLQSANTELESQKRQLQINAEALKKSNQELEQFAYVASHDLQEPLRTVSSYISLLSKRYHDKLDQDAREFIDFAMDGASRMRVLIQDLLDYSRITTHAQSFKSVDAEHILKAALDNLEVTIKETGAEITHSPLPSVFADENQLIRLFQNLIGNAIKYNRNKPEIHVSAERNARDWMFAFRDNGIGIDPRFRDRIFEIFKRLHTREEYSGTGIGLAVCKKIVERHGGRIWVDGKFNEGSTFYFTVPF